MDADVLTTGGPDCDFIPHWTWLDDPVVFDTKLGYSAEYLGFGEVLWFGYSVDLRDYGGSLYPGPFWTIVHHELFPDTFAFDGEDLTWLAEDSWIYGYGDSPYMDYSCTELGGNARGPFAADGVIGSMPCDYLHMDVYTFEADAGDVLEVSVDTVAAATTFHPFFVVNRPDGCVVGAAISTFECAFPSTAILCPGLELPIDRPGTYELMVAPNEPFCESDLAEYRLVSTGTTTTPVLLADDALRYAELRSRAYRTEVSVTVTRDPGP
jgi:hypothetical protein